MSKMTPIYNDEDPGETFETYQKKPKRNILPWVIRGVVVLAVVAVGFVASVKIKKYIADHNAQIGTLTEDQQAMQEQNLLIGKLQGQIKSQDDLQDQVNRFLKERDDWKAEAGKWKLKADSLTHVVADLETRLKHEGKGGPIITEGSKITGWAYNDGRLDLKTDDVMRTPPLADYKLSQHFVIDSLTMKDKAGVRVPFVSLREVDDAGKPIGEARIVEGKTDYTIQSHRWYDHVVMGVDAGMIRDAEGRFTAPVRGKLGYRALGAFPWHVYAEPWAGWNVDKFTYGAGLLAGFEY